MVIWEDIEDKLEWEHLEEVKKYKCPIIYSVGWLIEDNKKYVKICMHDASAKQNNSQDVSTVSTIPRGVIREIKLIKNINKKGDNKNGFNKES
jgi:hypothetical protein